MQKADEHVMTGAGELHVERCLKDLQERSAKCEIQASAPISPFREIAIKGVDTAPPKIEGAPRGMIAAHVSHNLVSYRIRAQPLPRRARLAQPRLLPYPRAAAASPRTSRTTSSPTVSTRSRCLAAHVSHNLVSYRIRAQPLPTEINDFLNRHSASARGRGGAGGAGALDDEPLKTGQGLDGQTYGGCMLMTEELWDGLESRIAKCGPEWNDVVDRV